MQDTLMQGTQEDINVIFLEMTRHLRSLMMHWFGNLAVQKLIDVVDDNKLDQILGLLNTDHRRFSEVCTDYHRYTYIKSYVHIY